MPFPEGLYDKKDQLIRPDVLQPKVAYDARELEAGPGGAAQQAESTSMQQSEDNSHLHRIELTSRNVHGLRSKSEELYPEAYFPVDTTFWEGLSEKQQAEVMRLQAVAQEKVGYERGTQKYFMQDFDPQAVDKKSSGERLVEIETPRLLLAGSMIGAGITMLATLAPHGIDTSPAIVTAAVLLAVGIATAIVGRN